MDKILEHRKKVRLNYTSRPSWKRPAYIPTVLLLSIAWILAISLLIAAARNIVPWHHNTFAAVYWTALGLSTILVISLAAFSMKYVDEFSRDYSVELTDDEVRVKVWNRKLRRMEVKRMRFSDVWFVAYFTPRDSASFTLHSKDKQKKLEIPAWSLTDNPESIEEFLKKKHLHIERV